MGSSTRRRGNVADRYLQLNTIGNAEIRPASSSVGGTGRTDVALAGGTVSGNEASIETAGWSALVLGEFGANRW
jgi:hypothetical protein